MYIFNNRERQTQLLRLFAIYIMAVTTPKGTVAECHRFPGNRARVIERATVTAMLLLLKQLI